MKRMLSLIIILVFVFSLIGCQTSEKSTDGNKDASQGMTVNEIDFENISIEDLDSDVQEVLEEAKKERGYKLINKEKSDYKYLAVFAGEKPNAGYDVEITKVIDNEGVTNVTVQEIIPREETLTAQVMTYPMDIVKLTGITDHVNLNFITKEKELEDPSESQSSTLLETQIVKAEYVGQIDNNSIEVKIEDGPKALRLNGIAKDQLEQLELKQGDIVKLEVFMNEHNQETVYSMEKIK